jgi:diketogulonate reductase-like aldo/keto reductase
LSIRAAFLKEIGMPLAEMRRTELPTGDKIPVLGQGTWHLGQDRRAPEDEIAALRFGLDLDMNLIDTAEMYCSGSSEELVGRAIAGRRDEVFLVSKVLPWHATRGGTQAACHASLDRLKTDRLDLYLLHWQGAVPLAETVTAFVELQEAGAIRHWGVSNFALSDLEEVVGLPDGWSCSTDQVLYNLVHRGIELDVLPWCGKHQIPVMAYSPIEQGRMLTHHTLLRVAQRHGATPAQVALAWIISQDGLMAIPEAGSFVHVKENRGALDVRLTDEDYAELIHAFPAPRVRTPLEAI